MLLAAVVVAAILLTLMTGVAEDATFVVVVKTPAAWLDGIEATGSTAPPGRVGNQNIRSFSER